MRIIATKVVAKELLPGDLFSTAGQNYWDNYDPESVGEKVYIRTMAPAPPGQEEIELYRITIDIQERCACGLPLHYENPDLEKRIRALISQGGEFAKVKVGSKAYMVQRHYVALHNPGDAQIIEHGTEVEA